MISGIDLVVLFVGLGTLFILGNNFLSKILGGFSIILLIGSIAIDRDEIHKWHYGADYKIKKLNKEISELLEQVDDKKYQLRKEERRANDI